jgi:hypothetical protein
MSCKLHFYWSEYSNFRRSLIRIHFSKKSFPQNWFRRLFSAFDSLVYAPHLKNCQLIASILVLWKDINDVKGMFIFMNYFKNLYQVSYNDFLTHFILQSMSLF